MEAKQTDLPSSPPNVQSAADKSARAKFLGGFAFAFAGLRYCFRTQINFRVHISISILVIILGLAPPRT